MIKGLKISDIIHPIYDTVAILEGGLGLDDEQIEVRDLCIDMGVNCWTIDELYKNQND